MALIITTISCSFGVKVVADYEERLRIRVSLFPHGIFPYNPNYLLLTTRFNL